LEELIMAMGIPSAVVGLAVWWLKRYIDKRDADAEKREKNTENLIILMMKEIRANSVMNEATAKAVQRIPDAHCNGDMTAALERVEKLRKEEEQFMLDQGIKHVFGE
jgi:hypothetical protein